MANGERDGDVKGGTGEGVHVSAPKVPQTDWRAVAMGAAVKLEEAAEDFASAIRKIADATADGEPAERRPFNDVMVSLGDAGIACVVAARKIRGTR